MQGYVNDIGDRIPRLLNISVDPLRYSLELLIDPPPEERSVNVGFLQRGDGVEPGRSNISPIPPRYGGH